MTQGERVDALFGEIERDFVDGRDVAGDDDGLLFDVAESGDLGAHVAGDGAVGAAEQDVGLDADGEHFLDAVLGGLGLELLRGGDPGDERHVGEAGVFAAQVLAHLADGFEEGQGLDVADGAADLDDGDVAVRATLRMAFLISLVTWGMTWTVLPR